MDVIVKSVSRIMFPLMLLMGIYIVMHGHLTPGGGFPGGVTIATAFAMIMIAHTNYSMERKLMRSQVVDGMASVTLFLLIIWVGCMFRDALLGSQTLLQLWSGGFTMLTNISGSLIVAAAMIVLVYSMLKG